MIIKKMLYIPSKPEMINKSLISSCLVSLTSVLLTQFTLALLPLFFPKSSSFDLLPLSVVLLVIVTGLCRFGKKILGVTASAPAFVLFTIFFIWALYICVVRLAVSASLDAVFHGLISVLIIGFFRFRSSDPGFLKDLPLSNDLYVQSPDSKIQVSDIDKRAKYCKACESYVVRFDHHCPALGKCVGKKNHLFFVVLVLGFIISEASFTASAYRYVASSNEAGKEQADVSLCLVSGSMLFCFMQLLWQVPFVMWHIYCACFNIKTDEWINWRKYPEFYVNITSQTAQSQSTAQFKNPYDKGMVMNLKEFLTAM